MVENNAEYGEPESDEPESETTLCRVWAGNRQPLPSTISPEGHRETSTPGGRRFTTLYFKDGKPVAYNLQEIPISVEYLPYTSPCKDNIRATWCDRELLQSTYWIPHEVAPFDRNNNKLCLDVFLASRKPSALERILRTTQNYLRPFVNKLRGVLI